jgi:pimeloyl-ACP methyl ester carboxylesterase
MRTVRSADGTPIAFDCAGDGPALIVVAGALQDRPATVALAASLAPRFTVYRYDRRGRGDSGDTGPYSADREIADLSALIAEARGSAFVRAAASIVAGARHRPLAGQDHHVADGVLALLLAGYLGCGEPPARSPGGPGASAPLAEE